MERYVEQLLEDIRYAAANVALPYPEGGWDLNDWISPEEEERTAPRRMLEEWTGIRKVQLPPEKKLNDGQINRILDSLKEMLNACNWSFVLQTEVPERMQYEAIRDNFDQEVIVKRWHMGFFEHCRPGTPHGTCALGEHCQCLFFKELLAGFSDEELSPEEERAMELECEIKYLRRRYGRDWEKYYPYHLDPEYDDEEGNPYDYGFGRDDEDEDKDDWWRK